MGQEMVGWRVRRFQDAHVIEHRRLHWVLSSAPVGGGWVRTRTVLIRYVPRDYDSPDPAADLRVWAQPLGLREPFVGFLTAVLPNRFVGTTEHCGGLTVSVWATVGLSHATAAGLSRPVLGSHPGTINLFIAVDQPLHPAAMVNAVITTTEAKAAVLAQWEVRTPEGWLATGTPTDAVAVACPLGTPRIPYAGPATLVGWLIGRAVRRVLEVACS
ncbi:MAG: adenosylcobinamide amidohydrolase [Acidobacteria bacterium]|nr:adenosylcobinamide amidohydrolase [Acidobacteriota bacterium]MDW7984043.1 adenosylcobinamide amidohydrolase [Acidobacteriota bacterium]